MKIEKEKSNKILFLMGLTAFIPYFLMSFMFQCLIYFKIEYKIATFFWILLLLSSLIWGIIIIFILNKIEHNKIFLLIIFGIINFLPAILIIILYVTKL